MKCVILAAGEGLRMRPLTLTTPKPMLILAGKPLLHHIFDALPDTVDEVILVVGYLKDQIRNYFQNQFGRFSIRYVYQEKKLGTGHGLFLCKELLGNDPFLMLYADDLQSKHDLERLILHPLSMLIKEVDNPERFGVVTVDAINNILDVVEKPAFPRSRLVSTGAKVLDSRIFHYQLTKNASGEYYLTDPLARLARDHSIRAVIASFWLPIGYPEDLIRARDIINKKLP